MQANYWENAKAFFGIAHGENQRKPVEHLLDTAEKVLKVKRKGSFLLIFLEHVIHMGECTSQTDPFSLFPFSISSQRFPSFPGLRFRF